jgi:hypothetical protein
MRCWHHILGQKCFLELAFQPCEQVSEISGAMTDHPVILCVQNLAANFYGAGNYQPDVLIISQSVPPYKAVRQSVIQSVSPDNARQTD